MLSTLVRWISRTFVAGAIGIFVVTAANAQTLPSKDGGTGAGADMPYQFDFFNGDLHVLTGDSVYRLDATTDEFTQVVTGIRSVFSPSRYFSGAAMAISDTGAALVSLGFNRGAVSFNLTDATPTPAALPDFTGNLEVEFDATTFSFVPARDENGNVIPAPDNFYSIAADSNGTFILQASVNTETSSSNTQLYRYDPVTTSGTALVDPTPGDFSGGLVRMADGTFVAGSIFYDSNWNATSRFTQLDLSADPTTVTPLATALSNGNSNIVFDLDGNLIFTSLSGVGYISAEDSQLHTLFGDLNDPTLFDPLGPAIQINGLAYDATTNQIIFAWRNREDASFQLAWMSIPEPASLGIMIGLAVFAISRRRRLA